MKHLPAWFAELGTDAGISRLEARYHTTVSHAYRLFYRYPALACWLVESATDVFLGDYDNADCPPTVFWDGHLHFIVGHLIHSDLVIAVSSFGNDPFVNWGADGASEPLRIYRNQTFSHWLIGLTTRYAHDDNHR